LPDPATGSANLTVRCYCGTVDVTLPSAALRTVTYCHCQDCRRWTGSPLPTFAAFESRDFPDIPGARSFSVAEGVQRWICATCGSPIAARFEYLPGQVYVPLGVLDQAADLAPELHCHADAQMPWLHLEDGLPRSSGSGRAALNEKAKAQDD